MRKQPRAITRHGSLFELKREQARDAVAAHRDAVDDLRRGHGDAVVRNQDELRALGQSLQDIAEARHVGSVEGGIYLIKQAERRRVDL